LTYILEEISCATCIRYFPTAPKSRINPSDTIINRTIYKHLKLLFVYALGIVRVSAVF